MTQPIPGTSARVERIAADMREADNAYAHADAIGRIKAIAHAEYRSDNEARAAIRDVLDALDLVLAERRGGAR